MGDFGFDSSIITGNLVPQSRETLADLLQKRTENQQRQAQLQQQLYNQQRERSLSDIVSQNAGAYSNPMAQALARGGFGDQAAAAQAEYFKQQTDADNLVRLHKDLLVSQAGTVKTPEQAEKFIGGMHPDARDLYGFTGEEKGKDALDAVQGLRSSAITPEQQESNQLKRDEINKSRYKPDAFGRVVDTWTGQVAGNVVGTTAVNPVTGGYYNKHGQAPSNPQPSVSGGGVGAPTTDANPYPNLKPKEIEAKWKDFRDTIGTVKARGRLTGGLQERLNAAERLEALVLGPNGDIQNLTPQQLREAATATASLIGGGGGAALGQIEELVPHTMAGQFANLKQKLLNEPQGADAQAFLQNMLDTAGREKRTTLKQMQGLQLQGVPDFIGLRKLDKGRFERDLRGAKLDPALIDDDGLMRTSGGTAKAGPGELVLYLKGAPHAVPADKVQEAKDKYGFTEKPNG